MSEITLMGSKKKKDRRFLIFLVVAIVLGVSAPNFTAPKQPVDHSVEIISPEISEILTIVDGLQAKNSTMEHELNQLKTRLQYLGEK